jgi:hypothetical protein
MGQSPSQLCKDRTMKKLSLILILIFLSVTTLANAEFYKIYVKRIDQNLYKDMNSGTVIVTQWCYEYAYGENAILKYDRYSYDNKLIFNSGTTCDVSKVLS